MKAETYYKVTAQVAVRTGMTRTLYRTADGHYVCSARDLRGIRLEPEEYITGIEGVERITYAEAQALIEEGGRTLGLQASDLPSTSGESLDPDGESLEQETGDEPNVSEQNGDENPNNDETLNTESEIVPENDETLENETENVPGPSNNENE